MGLNVAETFQNLVERATTRITGTLTEEDGITALPGSTLTTFVMNVYGRDAAVTALVAARDILNANNATVSEAGAVVILLSPDDMAIIDDALPYESHVVRLDWTWGVNPVKTGRYECVLAIRNLDQVP